MHNIAIILGAIAMGAAQQTTCGGNGNGQACTFPFTYKGKVYNKCTFDDSSTGTPWCATTANYDRDGKWGHCECAEDVGRLNEDSFFNPSVGPLTCGPDKEQIGALCYTKCEKFGNFYRRSGTYDCWQYCPSGMRDDGNYCRYAEYGRGVGYPWKFGDGLSLWWAQRRCENDHKDGCEKNGAIYYPKCADGYHNVGCCICRPNNQPDCNALGLGHFTGDLSCHKHVYHSPGLSQKDSCDPGHYRHGSSCYKDCPLGFRADGPQCRKFTKKSWECEDNSIPQNEGQGLESQSTSNRDDCMTLCENKPGCNAFAWYSDGGACRLKGNFNPSVKNERRYDGHHDFCYMKPEDCKVELRREFAQRIKNRHGICLDAPQRNTDGGKVHMVSCDDNNRNQQWTYDNGQIKNVWGKCLHDDGTNHLRIWTCDRNNRDQQWTYDGNTGLMRSSHPNSCLDAAERNTSGGKVHMFHCDPNNKNQQWNIDEVQSAISKAFRYGDWRSTPGIGDATTSLQVFGQDCVAEVFEHDDFQGWALEYSEGYHALPDDRDYMVSSVKVFKAGDVSRRRVTDRLAEQETVAPAPTSEEAEKRTE